MTTPTGPTTLDSLIVRGARAQGQLADRITSARVQLSASLHPDAYSLSRLTLRISDPGRAIWNTHLFDLGASVRFGALYCMVAASDLQDGPDGPQIVAECRSWGMEKLGADRGAKTWSPLTLAQLTARVAEPFGLRTVVQSGPTLPAPARLGPDPKVPGARGESSLQMLQRYGKEAGWVVMEAYGTVYIGAPSYLVTVLPWAKFDGTRLPDEVLAITSARRTTDEYGRDERVVTFSCTQELAARMAPGQLLFLSGVERFSRDFLVTTVDYDVATEDPATVTVVLPVDPPAAPVEETYGSSTDGGGTAAGGEFGRFVNALISQESGGSYSAVNSRTGALGRYQVMPANVGPWSKRVLGRAVTAAEFLRTPALQDQIAVGMLWTMFQRSGARGAAAEWYSGKPERQNDYSVFRKGEPSVGAYCDEVLARMREVTDMLPAGYTGPGSTSTSNATATGKTASAFATLAQQQVDGSAVYVFGAEASVNDASPDAFDCSELIEWCLGRLGITFPDGSAAQINACQSISVTQAAGTRGALLHTPGHIAISMGDGVHTIEAASTKSGLKNGNIGKRFSRAGLIPGLSYALDDPGVRRPGG